MKHLSEYEFKFVNIVDTYGKEYKNYYVYLYTSAANNEENEASIGILPSRESKSGVELFRSEIKSIELVG